MSRADADATSSEFGRSPRIGLEPVSDERVSENPLGEWRLEHHVKQDNLFGYKPASSSLFASPTIPHTVTVASCVMSPRLSLAPAS